MESAMERILLLLGASKKLEEKLTIIAKYLWIFSMVVIQFICVIDVKSCIFHLNAKKVGHEGKWHQEADGHANREKRMPKLSF